jgi:hypothetical protein
VPPPGESYRQLILGGKPSSQSWHTIVCHGWLYFATGTKRSDDKTTPGASNGLARRGLPRRIHLHLPGKRETTNTMLRQSTKHTVLNSTNSRSRVHGRCGFKPGKTPARRQRTLQGIPRQPSNGLYDHHNRGHTKRTIAAQTAMGEQHEGGILIPLHPFPD